MRCAENERVTKETNIKAQLCLDGGEVEISTGIGFFDHMLTAFAVHGGFGLKLTVKGDLEVDGHHTVEDTAIVLGKLFAQICDKSKINRFGSFYVPMDEALAFCSLDISGRPYLVYDVRLPQSRCGEFDTCLALEFFRAFADNAGITLHIKSEYGVNSHHILEAVFKAAAHSLRIAVQQKEGGVLSTKGMLE